MMSYAFRRTSRMHAVRFLMIVPVVALSAHGADPTTRPAATTSAPAGTTVDIDRFNAAVARLSDDESRVRAAARDELTSMGDAAEPHLKAVLARGGLDAETEAAIQGLIARLAEARDNGPTLVTLRQVRLSPKDAFDELARQGKLEFAAGVTDLLTDSVRGPIDVYLDHAPLWDALHDVCGKSRVAFRAIESGRVSLEPVVDGVAPVPVATSGPFMVSIARIETNISKSIAFGGLKPMNVLTNRNAAPPCRMYMFAWSEPKLKPIRWFIDSIDECTTDGGGKIAANPQPGLRPMGGTSGMVNSASETQLLLNAPPAGARKLTSLKMTTRFVIQRGMDKLELGDILTIKNRNLVLAGMGVVIKGVNKVSDSQYNYEVSVLRGSKSNPEWTLITSLLNQYPCKLVDAEGRALHMRGGSGTWGSTSVDLSQTLSTGAQVGEPVKLTWEFPSDLDQFVAPLEFRDVPLP